MRNLADVTLNERNYFTALFEKNESSYENYRNQLLAASCTNLIPYNNISLNSVVNEKGYMTRRKLKMVPSTLSFMMTFL